MLSHLLSARGARPSDDPIFALNAEATARRAAGEAIVNATVGTLLDDAGDLAVLPTAAQAIRNVPMAEWAAYAPIAGPPAFLAAAIHDMLAPSPELEACAVAVATTGGTGALRHAIANYSEVGQAILTSGFFWAPYQTIADEAERRVETFQMFAPDGSFDVAALDAALELQLRTQKRALIFINDPCHNPTGYSLRENEWRAIAACLERRADRGGVVTLLLDFAYSAYFRGDSRASLRCLAPIAGKVQLLFAWSASKTFTHYGLRVGALIACVPDPKMRGATAAALSYSCRGTWSNCNRGGLYAITQLLVDPSLARACNEERAVFKELLDARVAAFNRDATKRQLSYPRYDGGFFVTVFHRDAMAKAELMRRDGAYVVPVKDALRVAMCSVAERDVARLVNALAE